MTKSERGKYNRAVKELKEVGASAAEIRRRAGVYKQTYPGIKVTPNGLVAHWSACKPPPSPYKAPPQNGNTHTKISPKQYEQNKKRIQEMLLHIGRPTGDDEEL